MGLILGMWAEKENERVSKREVFALEKIISYIYIGAFFSYKVYAKIYTNGKQYLYRTIQILREPQCAEKLQQEFSGHCK